MAASELMKSLIKQRENIETEIEEMNDVLQSQKGVGTDGPLIDSEGYPRADIDVYSVRHARHKLACLQNDHIAVMKDIEAELYKIHAEMREKQAAGDTSMEVADSPASSVSQAKPFIKVDRVDAGSPAADAGLQVGDKVSVFGSVTADNFINLKQIQEVVQHSLGRPVRVTVVRGSESVTLSLTPGPWSGRGNLGCNIVPIKS